MSQENLLPKYDSSELILLVNSNQGSYCPQTAVEILVKAGKLSAENEDVQTVLSGPYEEQYYEAWDDILNETITEDGKQYYICHYEDVWLVPMGTDIEDYWE